MSTGTGEHAEGFASLFRRRTFKVPRIASGSAKALSTEFHMTAVGFEGHLKLPKEKGIRFGWNKRCGAGRGAPACPATDARGLTQGRHVGAAATRCRFIVVRETRVLSYEKEKDKNSDNGVQLFDFRCARPPRARPASSPPRR